MSSMIGKNAFEVLNRALTIRKARKQEDGPELIATLANLGAAYRLSGEHARAVEAAPNFSSKFQQVHVI